MNQNFRFIFIGLLVFCISAALLVELEAGTWIKESGFFEFFHHESSQPTQLIRELYTSFPGIKQDERFTRTNVYSAREKEIRRRKSRGCKGEWQRHYSELHHNILNGKAKQRFLVYTCEHGNCGGYGNRLYGMISLFYLAVLTDRAFLINWEYPKPLQTYLQPRNIQWNFPLKNIEHLNTSYLSWSSGDVKNRRAKGWNVFDGHEKFASWFKNANFTRVFDQPVVVIASIWNTIFHMKRNNLLMKRAHQLGINILIDKRARLWDIGCAFEFLFQKTKLVERKLEIARHELQFKKKQFVIGLHIRTGDQSSFAREKFDEDTNVLFTRFVACAEMVETYLKKAQFVSFNFSWFLATDNFELKTFAIEHFKKMKTLNLKPRHIEKEAQGKKIIREDGLIDVLADHFMLSTCNFLILSPNSTFSKTAAGVGMLSRTEYTYANYCKLTMNQRMLRKMTFN